MPSSPDLLRDAEVLRKLLTECLRRVDRLERQLRNEAASAAEAEPSAAPRTDPFEQVLPAWVDQTDRDQGAAGGPPHAQAPLRKQEADDPSTIRTLHLSPYRRVAEPDASGCADPVSPHALPPRRPQQPRATDRGSEPASWEANPPSGDGTLDPFALLDMSVPPPEPDDAEIYRGMHALLGGLDVTPADDET